MIFLLFAESFSFALSIFSLICLTEIHWVEAIPNPMNAEIRRGREVKLNVSDKMTKDVKWSAPTFMYKGDIASFYMDTRKHVSLMFHTGASLPIKYGVLEGDGDFSRVAKFADMADIEKKRKALRSLSGNG